MMCFEPVRTFVAVVCASIMLMAGSNLSAQSVVPPTDKDDPAATPRQPEKPQAKPRLSERDVARAKPRTPLEAVLKDGIPTNAHQRARVRDSLYALLATAADEKAAKRISQALERVYLTSGSPTIDLLLKRGIKAVKSKKYKLGTEHLTAVTELAPDYAEGWNRRAYALYKQRDLHRAAGDLRRVLALDPNHFRALDGLGTILQETGDEAGAFEVYKRLIEVNPNWPKAAKAFKDLKRKVEGRGI